MFIEILIAVLSGISAGIVTGLIPGIHINLVSVILVSLSGYLLGFIAPVSLSVFIIAMAVTHTFLDTIPSVFLGAPDPDTALNVLPGHRLLMRGIGYEAVKLTVIGSLLGLISTIILMIILVPAVPKIYSFISPYIGEILLSIIAFMIMKEISLGKKLWATAVFGISGTLGIIVLSMPGLEQPLFPLLSGLFGTSMLLMSLSDNVEIPKQRITDMIKVSGINKLKSVLAAVFSGSLTGLLPGVGSASAALLSMQIVGNIGMYSFMILIGGINTVNFVFSIATLYALEKARNGAIVAVLDIIKSIGKEEMIVFVSAALFAGGIATFLALYITRIFTRVISAIDYRKTCISIIVFISLLVFWFDGFTGLLVLATSTAVGVIAPAAGVKRSNAMGCLMVPVMRYFLF